MKDLQKFYERLRFLFFFQEQIKDRNLISFHRITCYKFYTVVITMKILSILCIHSEFSIIKQDF